MTGEHGLVGRDRELALLAAAFRDVRAGRGAVVTVSGEPGVGKTATARAFASEAAGGGALILWGSCFEGSSQAPYEPWETALGRFWPGSHTGSTDALPAPEARLRLFASIQESLAARARTSPVVAVIDDLHWASRDSAELFGHVATRTGGLPLLVLGTFRDPDPSLEQATPLAALLGHLARLPHHRRIHLRGLDPDGVARCLADALGDVVPPAVVRAVQEQTAGNPFFVREVTRALVDDGKLVHQDGRWFSDFSVGALRIPDTVRDAVRGRVAGLSEPTNALLRAASLFAGDVDLTTVSAVAGLTDEEAIEAADEALAAGLLQTTGRQPAAYAWSHAIVRHALAESLNPDRAVRMHRRAAEALEGLQGRIPADPAAIGEHYWMSRSLPGGERGADHCVVAAERAADHHAYQEAIRLLQFALDMTSPGDAMRRTAILERLAVAQAEALDYEHAPDTTLLALDALEPERGAELILRVVEALRQGSPLSAYEPLVHRGLDLLAGPPDARWARLATVLEPVDAVTVRRLSVGRWRGYPEQAVSLLRETGLGDDEARTIEPFLPRTEHQTMAILERSTGWSSVRARMRALDIAGRDLSLRHGLPVAAVDCYRELLALGERVGSVPAQAEAHGQLALCLALVGDLPNGEAHLARAGALVKELWPGHRLHLLGTLSSSAVVSYLVGSGDWAEMARGLDGWIRSPAAARAPFATVFVTLDALCHAFAGDRQEALGVVDELADLLVRLEPQDHGVAGSLWFATAAVWELGEPRAAERLVKLVDRHMDASGPPGPAPLTHAAGRLAAVLGDREQASALFARARDATRSSGARGVRALVELDDALLRGDAARVSAASRGCEALGMRGWVRTVRERDGAISRTRPAGLTEREVEVLGLVAAGYTSAEIAERLVVSVATVNRHVANIYTKISVRNRVEATAFAISSGLVAR